MAKKNDGNKSSVVNFGLHGWLVIIYCLLMFWLYAGMVNSGTNATAPALAQKFGVQSGTILSMNTLSGVLGVVFFIILGQVNRVWGAVKTSGILMILGGLGYIGVGNSVNITMYTACMTLVVGTVMSAGYISGGQLVTDWFPKKKGIVMGYTTMGHNLASAVYVPLITTLVGSQGVEKAVVVIGAISFLVGLFGLFFIKNTPQERNMTPDNVSAEVYANEYDQSTMNPKDDGGWTVKKLLSQKETWLVAICTGFFQICSLGVVSQFVVRNVELGFDRPTAIALVSLVAIIGLVGSFFVGYVDERLGTKKAMIIFGIWYAISLFVNATNNMWMVYLSIFMIGMSIGGSANFTSSLPISVFGRKGFSKVNSVIFPIQGAVSAFSFVINGIIMNLTGGQLRWAYVAFGVVSLLAVVIVFFVDEFKFNDDVKAAQKDTNK